AIAEDQPSQMTASQPIDELETQLRQVASEILPDSVRLDVVENLAAPKAGEDQFALRTPTEVKVFHGTPSAGFERFSFENAPVEAVFFTDAPAAASEYAGQRFLEPPTRAERYLGYTEPDVNVAVYPTIIETKNFKTLEWGGQTFNDGRSKTGLDVEGEITLAKQEGYEGLIVKNIEDTGGPQNQYVTWTKGTVRSAISGDEMFALRSKATTETPEFKGW